MPTRSSPSSTPGAAGNGTPPGGARPWDGIHVPILAGYLRGFRWAPASRGKIARILLGTYEPEQTDRFHDLLEPGHVLVDVGANAGYYTLLGAHLVGPGGVVVALEPEPRNAFFLRQHVAANGLSQVRVFEAAAGAVDGEAWFARGRGSGTGHIGSEGDLRVPLVRLDTLLARESIVPTHVKIDVEGAELDVLRGADEMLAHARPIVFLSTHGAEVKAECLRLLEERSYECTPFSDDDVALADELLCHPR